MLNYIRAELFRNFNRAYLWVFSGSIALLTLLANVLLKVNHFPYTSLATLFEMGVQMMILPIFLVIVMIDMSTAEEQKNLTMKNVVAFGISRNKLVLSKLVTSVILSFICAFIILSVFFGSGAILLGIQNGSSPIIIDSSIRLLSAIPLWIGAISVGIFLAVVINNNTAFSFVYGGVFLLTSKIIKILVMFVSVKFQYLENFLITTQLGNLSSKNLGEHAITHAILLGFAYIILFTVLAMVYIKKKEIK